MAVAMRLQLGNQVSHEQTTSLRYRRCYQNSHESSPLQGRAAQQSQQVFPLRHKGPRGDVLPCPSRAFLSLSYQNSGVKSHLPLLSTLLNTIDSKIRPLRDP